MIVGYEYAHTYVIMAIDKRVQVLMEPAEFAQLEALAGSQGISVGELIRQAVRERHLMHADQRRSAAQQLCKMALTGLDPSQLEASLTVARSEGLR